MKNLLTKPTTSVCLLCRVKRRECQIYLDEIVNCLCTCVEILGAPNHKAFCCLKCRMENKRSNKKH